MKIPSWRRPLIGHVKMKLEKSANTDAIIRELRERGYWAGTNHRYPNTIFTIAPARERKRALNRS